MPDNVRGGATCRNRATEKRSLRGSGVRVKGDGHDVINNYAYSGVQDKDVLKFGEGI